MSEPDRSTLERAKRCIHRPGDVAYVYRFATTGRWDVCAAMSMYGYGIRARSGRLASGNPIDRCLVLTADGTLTEYDRCATELTRSDP